MSDYKLPPWIPEDVSEALREAAAPGWQGRVEIHFNDGQAHEVSATRRRKVKRKGPPSGPMCPECESHMEPHDYGNMYLCPAGHKRTKAQMALRGVSV
jgi:hypothetical protein